MIFYVFIIFSDNVWLFGAPGESIGAFYGQQGEDGRNGKIFLGIPLKTGSRKAEQL